MKDVPDHEWKQVFQNLNQNHIKIENHPEFIKPKPNNKIGQTKIKTRSKAGKKCIMAKEGKTLRLNIFFKKTELFGVLKINKGRS